MPHRDPPRFDSARAHFEHHIRVHLNGHLRGRSRRPIVELLLERIRAGYATPFRHGPPRGRRGGGEEAEPVPVEPHRPNNLSGGAEAPLEYDE